MAVAKKDRSEPNYKQIKDAIVKQAEELLKVHGAEIVELYEESEDGKATINLGAEIDCSESEPMVTTRIRFSTSVTDKRVSRLDDPKQIRLFTEMPKAKKDKDKEDGEKPEKVTEPVGEAN